MREEEKVEIIEKAISDRNAEIEEMGEIEYARKLGVHVAELVNNGQLCRSFSDRQAYGSLIKYDECFLDIEDYIEKANGKIEKREEERKKIEKTERADIRKYNDLRDRRRDCEGETDGIPTEILEKLKQKKEILDKSIEVLTKNNSEVSRYGSLEKEEYGIDDDVEHKCRNLLRQVIFIGANIRDLQNEMRLKGKSEKEINSVLENYVQGFCENINFDSISRLTGWKEETVKRIFYGTLEAKKQNFSEDLAEVMLPDGKKMQDNSIYNANKEYEEFYGKLSEAIKKEMNLEMEGEKSSEQEEKSLVEAEKMDLYQAEIESVKLSDIGERKPFFHFTRDEYIPQIMKEGLRSDLTVDKRENAVGKDGDHPCVYFSEGEEGVLKTIDVWIKWEYGRIASKKNQPKGDVIIIPDTLREAYETIYEDFKNRRYFQLDLVEGEDKKDSDFSYSNHDFKKEGMINHGGPNPSTRWLMGAYTDYETAEMEDWNMMTHENGRPIGIDRMKLITDERGRDNAIYVIEEIYERNRDKNIDLRYLDSFMKYLREITEPIKSNQTKGISKDVAEELKEVGEMDKVQEFFIREAMNLEKENEVVVNENGR